MIKLTHEHEIGFLFVERNKHSMTFRKKNESDIVWFFTDKEDIGTFHIIRSFHYLCLQTKGSLEFTREEFLYISNDRKHQIERFESFIESQSSTMFEVIRIIKDNSFVDESHLILENMKTDDFYRTKHYFVFRSTLIGGLYICMIYDSVKKEFNDCFVHTEEDTLYELYSLYRSHDDTDRRILRKFAPILEKNKTLRLKLLLL
ncbi:hypothetical protein [Bacillus cereus]|uniref:hypothetical protein n=1 Tax=Bacillus cereus TaxID=1396 RepID=UPI000BECCBDE|nr:hypothetical protein [Bacillus cereus]PDY82779.1 hypothetical protein CON06_10270 [Bacillus cereus]